MAGMWAAVRDARPTGSTARARARRARASWLIPALSAASILLALVAGGLAVDRARLVGRQAELEAGVISLEPRLAALESRDLAAGTSLPVARILDIYRTARRSARS